MRKAFILSLLILIPGFSMASDLELVPISDPLYGLLEESYARGFIAYLPQMRPFTYQRARALADEAIAAAGDCALSRSLEASVTKRPGGLVLEKAWDGNEFVLANRAKAGLDADLSRPRDLVAGGAWLADLGLGFGDLVYLGANQEYALSYYSWTDRPYGAYLAPAQPDQYVYTYFLSTGAHGFNHEMAHALGEADLSITGSARMQFNIGLPFGTVQVGRQSLDWGPSPFSNLGLSRTSKPYEYFGYDFDIAGKGRFMWMTGVLQDLGFVRNAAQANYHLVSSHRLEYQVAPWLLAAIYESIVYSYRFELSYLNPLSLYYITEVNKGDNDNKMGGIDLVARLPMTKLYLSLMADDWDFGQILSFNYYHNIWGMVLGADNYSVPGLRLNAEYVYMSHWMYTHWIAGQQYQNWGSHLGHSLEPNSHMARLSADYTIGPGWKAGLSGWFTQHGRGNIDTPADWASEAALYGVAIQDLFYSFLDQGVAGTVIETDLRACASMQYTLPSFPITISGSYALEYVMNEDNQEGNDAWHNYLSLSVGM
jgi:hypothetical protein